MVNLTRIYTRTGDDGTTRLGDMSSTSKLDLRLLAYADCDEANSHIGVALASSHGDASLSPELVRVLTHIQNDLFDVGADLSCPVMDEDRKSTRLNSSHVAISYAVFCLKKKKRRQQRR